MHDQKHTHAWSGLSLIVSHGLITMLAIGIALALPVGAQFILYQWWPRVEADSTLLFTTEIAFASVLVLLFNLAKNAWDDRRYVAHAKLASLAYAKAITTGSHVGRRRRCSNVCRSLGMPVYLP